MVTSRRDCSARVDEGCFTAVQETYKSEVEDYPLRHLPTGCGGYHAPQP
jgi:hypothetical protein